MRSMEGKQLYNPEEDGRLDEQSRRSLDFLLETDSGVAEEELTSNGDAAAELFLANPVFKSEKAERALHKLKDVWKAAEENLPEELKNELRHEHKDVSDYQNPVHISSVVADAPNRQPGLSGMTQSHQDEDATKQLPTLEESPEEERDADDIRVPGSTSIYRQAIVYGFAVAMAVLLIFAFLNLL